MAVSRNTYDPAKKYRRVQFHQDRDLLDSELNELQDLVKERHEEVAHLVLKEGAIISGLEGFVRDYDRGEVSVEVNPGTLFIAGQIASVPGLSRFTILTPSNVQPMIWAEAIRYGVSRSGDPTLINPATGEPTAEREKWEVVLRPENTAVQPLPEGALQRITVPIYRIEKRSERFIPLVVPRSPMLLSDFSGTLDGGRITFGSVTEDQLAFAAAEGLTSLMQNLAERTFDEAGSYVVRGLDSYIGPTDGLIVNLTTNAGRAYVKGYRLQLDQPVLSQIPVSLATKFVRGEQKTFRRDDRRYPLNSRPLAGTSQVEAIAEAYANVTRGSVGAGADSLTPGPVVDIIDVRQGGTVYRRGIDWQQSGNQVDWLGSGVEPAIGTTYQVRWTYTRQLNRGVDYVEGGWFGTAGYPAAGVEYFYFIAAFRMDWNAVDEEREFQEYFYPEREQVAAGVMQDGGQIIRVYRSRMNPRGEVQESYRVEDVRPILSETTFLAAQSISRVTGAGEINRITWNEVPGADGYRIYRATVRGDRASYRLIRDVGNVLTYFDDGADTPFQILPNIGTNSFAAPAPSIGPSERSLVNFGLVTTGITPVDGSNISVDYTYYLGRKDLIYATTKEIKRLQGTAANDPKLPLAPENTLPLCAVDCPANSPAMSVTNFAITRVTMQELHGVMRDVEALKYNDAQFQQLLVLQNRDSQTKKGIYTDNFSNESQSDPFFPGYNARIDGLRQFATINRTTLTLSLGIDLARSTVRRGTSIATLPATEYPALDQQEWSELRNINQGSLFGKPPAEIKVTPNFGRKGRTMVTVYGSHFNPSISTVAISVDGNKILTNVSTDPYGRFTTSFAILPSWRWGWRTVEASDGANWARASLRVHELDILYRVERYAIEEDGSARAIREPVAELLMDMQRAAWRLYPMAQTFNFPSPVAVSAVGLFFGSKDATYPISIQIRGVTAGVPNDQIFAQKTLAPSEVQINTETKVVFDNPFFAQAGTSYAVVILTRSNAYRVRVATIGQVGQLSGGLITSQIYAPGVLLESSNAEAWTPVQGSDLSMRLYALSFQTQGELRFNAITGIQFGSLNLDEFSVIPQGTDVRWEFSTDGGSTWDSFVPGEEEQLPNLATRVVVRALFSTSTSQITPAVGIGDLHLMTYQNATIATYVTRELVTAQGIASAKVYTQMSIPSGTSVQWFCSNNGGSTWEQMAMEVLRPINQVWTEYTFSRPFTAPTGSRIRFQAVLRGTQLVAPRIHTLGATLT